MLTIYKIGISFNIFVVRVLNLCMIKATFQRGFGIIQKLSSQLSIC